MSAKDVMSTGRGSDLQESFEELETRGIEVHPASPVTLFNGVSSAHEPLERRLHFDDQLNSEEMIELLDWLDEAPFELAVDLDVHVHKRSHPRHG